MTDDDDINWSNLMEVISFAMHMAENHSVSLLVILHDDKPTYNIVHKSREDIWKHPDVLVIYDTDKTEEPITLDDFNEETKRMLEELAATYDKLTNKLN